jgi:hypothetical protein
MGSEPICFSGTTFTAGLNSFKVDYKDNKKNGFIPAFYAYIISLMYYKK